MKERCPKNPTDNAESLGKMPQYIPIPPKAVPPSPLPPSKNGYWVKKGELPSSVTRDYPIAFPKLGSQAVSISKTPKTRYRHTANSHPHRTGPIALKGYNLATAQKKSPNPSVPSNLQLPGKHRHSSSNTPPSHPHAGGYSGGKQQKIEDGSRKVSRWCGGRRRGVLLG